MNPGREMYCCQKTIQYPVKIKRKSMNFGFESTVRKLRPTCAIEGGGASFALRGSRKKNSTRKNIANTLTEATAKTFSTPRCSCAQPATYGPAVPPMLTRV